MGDAPLIVAPALSVIVDAIRKRPAWQHDQPFQVPSGLWQAGRDEMAAIMKKRGFPVAVSKGVRVENFMVYGTVVVAA